MIRDDIAKCLYEQGFSQGYWDTRMSAGDKIKWLAKADTIISLIGEAGYQSPEDCNACNQRQIESESFLNREAAFEEERLRGEVEYWKDKNYKLGG